VSPKSGSSSSSATGCFLERESTTVLDTRVIYLCDWHASHSVKVMLDQIFRENYFHGEFSITRTADEKCNNSLALPGFVVDDKSRKEYAAVAH